MSWNNGMGPTQGPWGQGPGSGGQGPMGTPPDLEKMMDDAKERLSRQFSGKVPGGKKIGWIFLITIVFLLWMATGVYLISPDEQGVVIRFGRYVETTGPGPHFHLPYPIETVYKPKVTQVQRIEVGYRTRGRSTVDVPSESLMLTGDENIIDIDLSVQYRIKNAADYLFNVHIPSDDPHGLIQRATEASIRQVVGQNSIDEALTTGKEQIQSNTQKSIQEILDGYKSGIHVVTVQLQQVAPPTEVVHAFKDVASAREDRERSINEAQGYANDILPKAKGEAAKKIQEAEAYKMARVARAKGDANRFLALLEAYKKAKRVTEKRLYLETMEEVFAGINKIIVDEGATQGVVPYLPLDRLTKLDVTEQGSTSKSQKSRTPSTSSSQPQSESVTGVSSQQQPQRSSRQQRMPSRNLWRGGVQ